MENSRVYWQELCRLQKDEYEHLKHAEVQTKRRLARNNKNDKLFAGATAMELAVDIMSRVTDDLDAPASAEDLETLRCLSNSAIHYCKLLRVAPVKRPRRTNPFGAAKSRCTESIEPFPSMRRQLKRKGRADRKSRTDEDADLPAVERATFPLVDLDFRVEIDGERETRDVCLEYGDAYCTLDLEDKNEAPVRVKLAPMIGGRTNFKAECLQEFAPMVVSKITELIADNLEEDHYHKGQHLRVICETSLGTLHVIDRFVQ